MRPDPQDHVTTYQAAQKKFYDQHTQERNFEPGQEVMVRNWQPGPKYVHGTVLQKLSAVTYEVRVDGGIWHRHTNHLLSFKGSS